MKCKLCIEKEKTWNKENSEIECAFENWVFSEKNWNCWTMVLLREKAENNSLWVNDTNAWLIPYHFDTEVWYEESWFIYLEWYKSRGKTDKCIDMETLKPVNLELIEKILWMNMKNY